jgi:hypothetical protein
VSIYIYIHIYIYRERERDISCFLLWGLPFKGIHFQNPDCFWSALSVCGVSPLGESIYRILTFWKSDFCLRGLPFGGIHVQNPELFAEFIQSAGSPLWGNPFSESLLLPGEFGRHQGWGNLLPAPGGTSRGNNSPLPFKILSTTDQHFAFR